MVLEMSRSARIYVAGHRGLVGSAIVRRLRQRRLRQPPHRQRDQLDLRDQAAVNDWFRANRPEYVFLVAGTVGGILANSTRPAEFIYDNLMIHATVVHAALPATASKQLLYLGSSCIYPRECAAADPRGVTCSPALLEPTNESYAIAKIAGIKLCQAYRHQYGCDFISAMPTNLYGPDDNFDLESSHVLPALMRKFHEARNAGQRRGDGLGHRLAAARVPARRRPRRCLSVPDAALRRGQSYQRRYRRGPDHSRAGRDHRARSWLPECA